MSFSVNAQKNKVTNNTIGLNVAELPSLTIDLNYSYAIKPYFDLVGGIGYSFNHTYAADLNFILVPHIKCGNCGIVMKNQTGGFVKTMLKLNVRKSYETRNYLFIGIDIINSVVYEKADFSNYYSDYEMQESPNTVIIDDPIREQTKYIFGIGTRLGYSLKMGEKLQGDLGLQIAFPNNRYKSLFGYQNYIPGMGFKDSYSYWFPRLFFYIKY
jgi:hypothetical protein